jgi:hypothetical protein
MALIIILQSMLLTLLEHTEKHTRNKNLHTYPSHALFPKG